MKDSPFDTIQEVQDSIRDSMFDALVHGKEVTQSIEIVVGGHHLSVSIHPEVLDCQPAHSNRDAHDACHVVVEKALARIQKESAKVKATKASRSHAKG